MPFSGYRDIIQRRDRRLNTRQERRRQWRAVIVDSQGLQSGNGDIWADQNARRLWVMPVGGGQPYQVLCMRIGRPVIGLGVIVGYAEGSNTQEVLRDDYEFLGPSNVGISWLSPTNEDFQPGGRMQLWIQTKMIQPLSTYPTGGLTVGVVGGDYIYDDTRKTYAGTTGLDLTASQPAAGLHRFVGLYLDSANTLQTVNGATIAVTSTPPEPTWPAGSFRLSVVRIANPQTTIQFLSNTNPDNDIFDRRIPWVDPISFRGWPFASVLTVSTTDTDADYSTIAAAHTGASGGDTIQLDSESFSENLTFTKFLKVLGHGEDMSTIVGTLSTGFALSLQDVKINETTAGASALTATGGLQTYLNTFVNKANGTAPKAIVISTGAGFTHRLIGCKVTCSGGSGDRIAVSVETSGTVLEIYGGYLSGTTYDLNVASGATCRLFGPVLANGTIQNAGTVVGFYYDGSGNPYTVADSKLNFGNGAVEAPFNMTARSAAPSSPNTQDVYLDDGTNTQTLKPFFKRYNGTAWQEIGLSPLFKNPIINGAFQVWQRGTSFTSVANGTYTADRFIYSKVGTMVHDISRSTDVPTVAQAGVFTLYSFLVDCTTADGTIAASDLTIIRHYIEGFNFQDLAQRQFTLSFWVKATKTGIYCVSFSNSGGDRTWVSEYTINTTDTWELKTITVSASPSAGTWDYTTGIGLTVTWAIAAGSNFHITADAWQSSGGLSTSNQVNGCDDAANNFRLALIGITPGAVPLAYRMPDFGQELGRCQRYFFKTFAYTTAPAQNVGTNSGELIWISTLAGAVTIRSQSLDFPVPMRILPATIVTYNPGAANANPRDLTAGADTTLINATATNERMILINTTGNAATAVGNRIGLHITASAEF